MYQRFFGICIALGLTAFSMGTVQAQPGGRYQLNVSKPGTNGTPGVDQWWPQDVAGGSYDWKTLQQVIADLSVDGQGWIPIRYKDVDTGKVVPIDGGMKRNGRPKSPDPSIKPASRRSILVRVYSNIDGKWVEQPDKKLETTSDYDRAKDYFDRMNKMPGWKATWNAPGWPSPDLPRKSNQKDNEPYNPPVDTGKPSPPRNSSPAIAGTRWSDPTRDWSISFDGGKTGRAGSARRAQRITWTIMDDQVTATYPSGVTLSFVLKGGRLIGTGKAASGLELVPVK